MKTVDINDDDGYMTFALKSENGEERGSVRVDVYEANDKFTEIMTKLKREIPEERAEERSPLFFKEVGEYLAQSGFPALSVRAMQKIVRSVYDTVDELRKKDRPTQS